MTSEPFDWIIVAFDAEDADAYLEAHPSLDIGRATILYLSDHQTTLNEMRNLLVCDVAATDAARNHRNYEPVIAALSDARTRTYRQPESVFS